MKWEIELTREQSMLLFVQTPDDWDKKTLEEKINDEILKKLANLPFVDWENLDDIILAHVMLDDSQRNRPDYVFES
jgi:hypothetical protein